MKSEQTKKLFEIFNDEFLNFTFCSSRFDDEIFVFVETEVNADHIITLVNRLKENSFYLFITPDDSKSDICFKIKSITKKEN